MDETLVNFGSGIKTVEETDTGYKFGGWLVVFDSHDVSPQRDKFTKSTDFDIEDGDRITLFYNHGLDGTIKKAKLGGGTLSVKDAGIWLDGEVRKRTDYLAQHAQKIGEGLSKRVAIKGEEHSLFGLSSGALSHLVDRVPVSGGHEIKMWKIGEASITPTPAEPLTYVTSLKTLIGIEAGDELKDVLDSGSYAPEVKPSPKVVSARDRFRSGEMEDVCPDCGGEIEDGKCEACGYEVKSEIKRENGDWITINGAHVRIGSAAHRAIVGGSEKPSDTDVLAALDHHGITDEKARVAILDAHDRGHIGSHDQLHDIARSAKEAGGSEGHAVSAINRHGEGGNYHPSNPRDEGDSGRRDSDRSRDSDSGRDDSSDSEDDNDSGSDSPPASADDVERAASRSNLRAGDKAKLKKAHQSGKIKTRFDLRAAINAIRGTVREVREKYQQGRQLGESVGGKSLEFGVSEVKSIEYELLFASPEYKKYDPRQPRDDHGKWSSGPGGSLSVGHAIHVMKSEGIHDEAHHESVRKAIENGAHKSREDVLAHIDSIHSVNGTVPGGPNNQIAHYEGGHLMANTSMIVDKETGQAVREISLNSVADKVNREKYDVVPTNEYLGNVNRAIRQADNTQATAPATEKQGASTPNHPDIARAGVSGPAVRPEHVTQDFNILSSLSGRFYYVTDSNGGTVAQRGANGRYNPATFRTEQAARNFLNRSQRAYDRHVSRKSIEVDGEIYEFAEIKIDEYDETDTPEFKTLSELEDGLRGGSFSEFPDKVRGAVAGAVKHIEEMADARCVKSNRRWSETVHGDLLCLRDELKSATETIEALADAHAPRSAASHQEVEQVMAQYQMTLARLNGVTV